MEIPGYNIVDTLGEGRAATVYLAFTENSDQAVALKVFSKSTSSDKAFGEHFSRQASRLSELNHPNIAAVYKQGKHAGRYYLAMEYIPGRSLRHQCFDLELPDQLRILQIVARALGVAHELGCLHGNLTLDSIVLHSDSGEPVVLGFGVGWPIDPAVLGNNPSPEQGSGAIVDEHLDLYSLGQMLFLLLCNLLPHPGVLRGETPRLRDELAIFQPMLNGTLGSDPEQRYKSCEEFAEALNALTTDQLNGVVEGCEEVLMSEKLASAPVAKEKQDAAALVKPQAEAQRPRDEMGGPEPVMEGLMGESLAADSDDRLEPKATRISGWGAVLPWALALSVVLGALLIMLQPA